MSEMFNVISLLLQTCFQCFSVPSVRGMNVFKYTSGNNMFITRSNNNETTFLTVIDTNTDKHLIK